MTKSKFLETYRKVLVVLYPWAKDEAKLNRFMNSVETTIRGTEKTWNHNDSSAAIVAFREIGCKGNYSLKALKALAD